MLIKDIQKNNQEFDVFRITIEVSFQFHSETPLYSICGYEFNNPIPHVIAVFKHQDLKTIHKLAYDLDEQCNKEFINNMKKAIN
jgi:hypothetical protein